MRLAWSDLARDELHALGRFSTERRGARVALRYLEDLRDAAKQVAARPGRANLLRGPFRIMRVRSHYLILHVDQTAGRLTVARILHTSMDIQRHLP